MTTTLGGLILASYAAVTGRPWINVNYVTFLLHWWSISDLARTHRPLPASAWLLRPANAPILSWENWLYTLVRWPYIARGIFSAVLHRLYPRPITFKVTPKGTGELEPLPTRLMIPYILISFGSATAALIGEAINNAVGYVFLCIMAGFMYALISIAVPALHAADAARQCEVPMGRALRQTSLLPLIVGYMTLIPVAVAAVRYPAYALHVFHAYPAYELHIFHI